MGFRSHGLGMTSMELGRATKSNAWVVTKSDKTNKRPDCKQLRPLPAGKNTKERWSRNQSRLTQRKADHLEYTTITIDSYDKKHIKLHGWSVPEQVLQPFNGSRGQTQASNRKITYPALSVDTERKELTCSPFYSRTCSDRCSRAFGKNDRDMLAKEFCTILGPEMCNECLRSWEKTLEDAELTFCHPDVNISPYSLCVPLRTKSAINKNNSLTTTIQCGQCDAIYRRFGLVRSYRIENDAGVMMTRPSSCNSNCSNTFHTLPSHVSPSVTLPSFGSPCSSPDFQARNMASKFLKENSRNLCRTRFNQPEKKGQTNDNFKKNNEKNNSQAAEEDADMPPRVTAVTIRTLDGTKRLQYNNVMAKSKQKLSIRHSRKIERTGKLNELPYWKFLIPEPPQIGLERMNVSIYTPKSIPGIKIFDESLFEI